jgi:DmsE family decaheme c-type cytochrome
MRTLARGVLTAALFGVGASFALAQGDETPAAKSAAFDVNDCKACHEDTIKKFETTHHAGQAQSCATCHGDVASHLASELDSGEPGPIQKITQMKAAQASAVCLECHENGDRTHWAGGAHERRGVGCTSCHSVHNPQSEHAQLKASSDTQVCYGCHQNIRSKEQRVSHHPVREGLMACSDCHDIHDGSRPKFIKADSVNELCYSCHTEKRGPFLWEHAPVRENCMLCHDPHGSNHEKLLAAKQPYLCQRCHLNTRHPGTLYDQRNTLAGASTSNRAVEHACRNCHQNIHGSNAPSGPYLGR